MKYLCFLHVPRTIHNASKPISPTNSSFVNDLAIRKAAGSRLYDCESKVFVDLSSLHTQSLIGHNIREIHDGLVQQLSTGDASSVISQEHSYAERVSEQIMRHVPQSSEKSLEFHLSDCSAMEHAIKSVYLYWHQLHQPKRKTFVSFAHSFHGEAISCINFNASFDNHNHFQDFLIPVEHIPYPCTWFQDKDATVKETLSLNRFKEFLNDHHLDCAGIIIEPLLQTHNGMQACRPGFVNQVISLAKSHHLPVISDERNLSPMRSGQFFVSAYLTDCPDIIVTGNALTNHLCPLGVTIIKDQICAQLNHCVSDKGIKPINALAYIAANRTIDILDTYITKSHIQALQSVHMTRLHKLNKQPIIENVRYLGSIGAFEVLCEDRSQQQKLLEWFHGRCLEHGLFLEPFQKYLHYATPVSFYRRSQ